MFYDYLDAYFRPLFLILVKYSKLIIVLFTDNSMTMTTFTIMFTLQLHVTKFIQTRYVITITYYENNENKRKLLYPTYIRSFIAINKSIIKFTRCLQSQVAKVIQINWVITYLNMFDILFDKWSTAFSGLYRARVRSNSKFEI